VWPTWLSFVVDSVSLRPPTIELLSPEATSSLPPRIDSMPPELHLVVDASIVPATLAQPPPMNANGSLA
jgi:hypothetical protein